jgi:hypothetical protein
MRPSFKLLTVAGLSLSAIAAGGALLAAQSTVRAGNLPEKTDSQIVRSSGKTQASCTGGACGEARQVCGFVQDSDLALHSRGMSDPGQAGAHPRLEMRRGVAAIRLQLHASPRFSIIASGDGILPRKAV